MSPKRKPGLQRGLSEIVAAQTRPKVEDSRALISRFSEQPVPPHGIPPESTPPPRPEEIADISPSPVPPGGIPPPSIPPDTTLRPDLASLVSPERGYYPTFNDVSDRLIPELKLDAYEQAVLNRMWRLSRGWQKDSCVVGHSKLAKYTNLSRSTVQKTVARLLDRGLLEFVADRGNDGTEYRVLPGVAVPQRGIPSADIPPDSKERPPYGTRRRDGIPSGGQNKNREVFKEQNKKGARLTPEQTQAKASEVAARLRSGEGIDEIESALAPTMHPVDWAAVKSMAQATRPKS